MLHTLEEIEDFFREYHRNDKIQLKDLKETRHRSIYYLNYYSRSHLISAFIQLHLLNFPISRTPEIALSHTTADVIPQKVLDDAAGCYLQNSRTPVMLLPNQRKNHSHYDNRPNLGPLPPCTMATCLYVFSQHPHQSQTTKTSKPIHHL